MRGGEAFAQFFKLRAKAEREARGHFIGTLALLAEEIERTAKTAPGGKLMNAPAELEQAVANLGGQGFAQVSNVLVKFAAGLDDKVGGGRGRGSADIGNQNGDGEVAFVSAAGDYPKGGRRHRPPPRAFV